MLESNPIYQFTPSDIRRREGWNLCKWFPMIVLLKLLNLSYFIYFFSYCLVLYFHFSKWHTILQFSLHLFKNYLAICLKWNFLRGFLLLIDSLPFFQTCVFTVRSKNEIKAYINHSVTLTRSFLILERRSQIICCHFLMKHLHDTRRHRPLTFKLRMNNENYVFFDTWRCCYLRHNPNPVCRTA